RVFAQNAVNMNGQKIVIFFNSFDGLHLVKDEIREQFLETLRTIRRDNQAYAIHSIVACGTLGILPFNSTSQNINMSPFNAAESLLNPYLTLPQTYRLFDEFA